MKRDTHHFRNNKCSSITDLEFACGIDGSINMEETLPVPAVSEALAVQRETINLLARGVKITHKLFGNSVSVGDIYSVSEESLKKALVEIKNLQNSKRMFPSNISKEEYIMQKVAVKYGEKKDAPQIIGGSPMDIAVNMLNKPSYDIDGVRYVIPEDKKEEAVKRMARFIEIQQKFNQIGISSQLSPEQHEKIKLMTIIKELGVENESGNSKSEIVEADTKRSRCIGRGLFFGVSLLTLGSIIYYNKIINK